MKSAPEVAAPAARKALPARILPDLRAHRREFAACLASAVAGWFIFPSFAIAELAWVFLVPFFWALPRLAGRDLVWGTYLFGVVWFYGNLWWLNTLVYFNPFVPVGIVALAFICASYLLLFTLPLARLSPRVPPLLRPLAVALLWVGMEHARYYTELAFPWNCLGHSQVTPRTMTIVQMADLGGVALISFFIALANAMLADLLACARAPRSAATRLSPRLAMIAALFAVLTGLNFYGIARMSQWSGRVQEPAALSPADSMRIAVVQPNVSQLEKWAVYSPQTTRDERERIEVGIVRDTLNLVGQTAAAKPQLVVLPEAVFLSPWFVYDTALHSLLARAAAEYQTDILFGADNREPWSSYRERAARGFVPPRRDAPPQPRSLPVLQYASGPDGTTIPVEAEEQMAVFPSAWQVKPEGGLQPIVYDKVQLVPFGEQAPLLGRIPYFQDKIMMVGAFQPGAEQVLFETGGVRYGVMICFESTFARLSATMARAGAGFVAVITNDAWYDPAYAIERGGFWGRLFSLPFFSTLASGGPAQHFNHAILRAVETRLPLVRSANTGISAIIGPAGDVHGRTQWAEEIVFARDVRIQPDTLTFYTRTGDLPGNLALAVNLLIVSAGIVARFRAGRRKHPKAPAA